jgi:hypothetical protein
MQTGRTYIAELLLKWFFRFGCHYFVSEDKLLFKQSVKS